MGRNKWDRALADLRQETVLIECKAKETTAQLQALCREVESYKVDFLLHCLETQRKTVARRRGATALIGDQSMRQGGLLAVVCGFVVEGLITKDPRAALGAGMSSFNSLLEGLGQSRWVVSLGKRIVVAPQGGVPPSGMWVTWESLQVALVELWQKALAGQQLGDLDSLIARLRRGRRKLVYLSLPSIRLVTNQRVDPD